MYGNSFSNSVKMELPLSPGRDVLDARGLYGWLLTVSGIASPNAVD